MAGFNISSLFGNSSSGGFGSFNFSDYAAIKNGSYRKLMKSYYTQNKTEHSISSTDKTNKNEKIDKADSSGLSKMKSEADELKKAADALQSEDMWTKNNGEYDMDKITSAIKTFAKEYNDVIDQSGKVNSKDVATDTKFMMSITNTLSKSLSKIGVSLGTDGKLSVNEETLNNAKQNDLKALFSDSYSYGGQVSQKASSIGSSALRSSSLYSSTGQYSNSFSNYNSWV